VLGQVVCTKASSVSVNYSEEAPSAGFVGQLLEPERPIHVRDAHDAVLVVGPFVLATLRSELEPGLLPDETAEVLQHRRLVGACYGLQRLLRNRLAGHCVDFGRHRSELPVERRVAAVRLLERRRLQRQCRQFVGIDSLLALPDSARRAATDELADGQELRTVASEPLESGFQLHSIITNQSQYR